jgi:thymidylate synthase
MIPTEGVMDGSPWPFFHGAPLMSQAYLSGETIDDLMRYVVEEIKSNGSRIHPTKGKAAEVNGVLLEITDPRARLSRTETRGKPYSCLGELFWYLARTNALDFIAYYIRQYKGFADGDKIFGGYGPRLFDWKGINQLANVTNLLKKNPDSRKAVIQLFDANDIVEKHKDVPCTCTMQFMIRSEKMHMFTNMRSNDVFLGLAHDIFCFTMIQEIMARSLAVELGTYKHAVGSLHLYDINIDAANAFLDEGWQSTEAPMPPMPKGDPWPSIEFVLHAESSIRTKGVFDQATLNDVDPYWADLIRLLYVFRCKKDGDMNTIKTLRGSMSSKVYLPFIDKVLG